MFSKVTKSVQLFCINQIWTKFYWICPLCLWYVLEWEIFEIYMHWSFQILNLTATVLEVQQIVNHLSVPSFLTKKLRPHSHPLLPLQLHPMTKNVTMNDDNLRCMPKQPRVWIFNDFYFDCVNFDKIWKPEQGLNIPINWCKANVPHWYSRRLLQEWRPRCTFAVWNEPFPASWRCRRSKIIIGRTKWWQTALKCCVLEEMRIWDTLAMFSRAMVILKMTL